MTGQNKQNAQNRPAQAETTAICVRLPAETVARVRALVRASKHQSMTEVVAEALDTWAAAHPLAHCALRVPRDLPRGPRPRSTRAPRDFIVILDDDLVAPAAEVATAQ